MRHIQRACRKLRMRWLRRQATRYRKMVAEFTASRQPQSDSEFLADCLHEPTANAICWALAVRWAIARVGRVHPRYVHSDDRFPDLTKLPGWCDRGDAFFDQIILVMLIEDSMGVSILDKELEHLPNVENDDELRVREFVRKVVDLCATKTERDR